MQAKLENPILLVHPRKADLKQRVISGFGEPKEIVPVNRALRRQLTDQLDIALDALKEPHTKYPEIPSVLTLRLRPEAMAKTHRPMELLRRVGMTPIGTQRFGELLLPATPHSIEHLSRTISDNNAQLIKANISTIEQFALYTPNDVLQISHQTYAIHEIEAWIKQGRPFFLECFSSTDDDIDQEIRKELKKILRQADVRISGISPSMSGTPMIIWLPSIQSALTIAAFPGVRALLRTEEFSPIRIKPLSFHQIGAAKADTLPPPSVDFPIVAVVDTGISPTDKIIKPWVVARDVYVTPKETDHVHGTFVAGLIAGSRVINGNDLRFPQACARLLDVTALSTTGATTIDEMILAITESVEKHPEVKVWNCSFGSKTPGSIDKFGQLARELDALSDRHGVLFIIAAGNYEKLPMRHWPNPPDLTDQDRISLPAESVRALTIGSIAHVDALVDDGCPSPFSRRGPGPAKTPKPDLVHRGGNFDATGSFKGVGVRSLLPGEIIGESIGTSFSTPLVSAIAANTWQALEKQGMAACPEMVKALLIHAAALSSPKRTPEERNYYGFGVPDSVIDSLFCRNDTFTLLFDVELYDGMNWEKNPFPVPACLHPNGTHFKGEIILTLVYAPPVDGDHGSEYVRANVNAHFGSFDPDDEGVPRHHGLVPLDAPEKRDLYEEAMIDHGFKWSPVKVYRGKFRNGKAGKNFRLYLDLLRRAGEPPRSEPQRVIVLVTMRGLTDDLPVYNDGIRALRTANWTAAKVTAASHIRV